MATSTARNPQCDRPVASFVVPANGLDRFGHECGQTISRVLKRHIVLIRQPKTINVSEIRFYAKETGAPESDGDDVHRVQMCRLGDWYFWVSGQIKFNRRRGDIFQFRNVSLLVSSSQLVSDIQALPLFRAEWQFPDNGDWSIHAQPHWHILPGHGQSAIDSLSVSLERIHFAMAAAWHRGANHQVQNLTEREFMLWLQGCLTDICGQLQAR